MMKSKSKKNYMIDFFKDEKNHNREFTLSEYDSEVKKAYEAETGTNKIYTNRTPRNLIRYGDPDLNGILKRTKRGNYIFYPGEKFVIKKSPFSEATKKNGVERRKQNWIYSLLIIWNQKLLVEKVFMKMELLYVTYVITEKKISK